MKEMSARRSTREVRRQANLPLKHFRILVVDDARDSAALLRSMLKEAGASVVGARSVDTALKQYRQHPPHVLVASIHPGNPDGYRLIESIREHNAEYRGYTPAVVIMHSGSAQDETRAIEAGFNACLTGPFEKMELVHAITQVWQDSMDLAA